MKLKHLLPGTLLLLGSPLALADSGCNAYDRLLPRGPETPSIGSACDTLFPEWGGARRKMADYGFYAQAQLLTNLTYDVAGNRRHKPNYVGQRPTTGNFIQFDMTYDLDRLGLPDRSQLHLQLGYSYNNYRGNGQDGHPSVMDLSVYQPLFNQRVILHYGYSDWLNHFYGLYLGASTASSALGPTSVMLNQAGLTSLKPSPGLDVRVLSADRRWYDHIGVARSQSSDGLQADSHYNLYGLRWKEPHAGTLLINEVGYRVNAANSGRMTWIRGGSVYNKTPYLNYNSGRYNSETWSHYLAATQQLTQPDPSQPDRGWYIDGKTNYAPENRNLYMADASLTLFSIGPFKQRPADMVSFGVSYNKFSDDAKHYFQRKGQSADGFSTTGSVAYTLRVMHGIYWTNQLSWTHHPAITPHEDDAWNLETQMVVNL